MLLVTRSWRTRRSTLALVLTSKCPDRHNARIGAEDLSSVLTKPVMEQSLKTMLATAYERRRNLQRRNRPPDDTVPDSTIEHPVSAPDSPSPDQEVHTLSGPPGLGNGSALPRDLKATS